MKIARRWRDNLPTRKALKSSCLYSSKFFSAFFVDTELPIDMGHDYCILCSNFCSTIVDSLPLFVFASFAIWNVFLLFVMRPLFYRLRFVVRGCATNVGTLASRTAGMIRCLLSMNPWTSNFYPFIGTCGTTILFYISINFKPQLELYVCNCWSDLQYYSGCLV
jgi:hypothetical protein